MNADDHIDTSAGAQNSNLFAYCGNNPVSRIDPEGTEWWHWVAAAVVVVGLVAASIVTCGGAAAAAGAAVAIATGTCSWRQALPYGSNYSVEQVRTAVYKVYANYLNLLSIALNSLK